MKTEAGKRGGPGGMKCVDCDWQGSCDELEDEKCPQCGGEVKQVGKGTPPVESLVDAILEGEDVRDVLEAGKFAGWIAFYNNKKFEIKKSEANDLYGAKLLAITHFKVPKSKQGLLAIEPAYDE